MLVLQAGSKKWEAVSNLEFDAKKVFCPLYILLL